MIDVSTLKVGDRVVMIQPDTGKWVKRKGWNELPGRVTAVYPEQQAFKVTRYNRGNTWASDLVGRDFGIVWPKGHSKSKPFNNTSRWALAPADYKPTLPEAGYSRKV